MFDSPINVVGNLFRAFVSAIGLVGDVSVIAPLLATGCQGFSPKKMFRAMVTTCGAWMKVGMPLKLMKLVIYVQTFDNTPENLELIDEFNQFKTSFGCLPDQDVKLTKDIDAYMIYSISDLEKVGVFIDNVKKQNEEIKLFLKEIESSNQALDEPEPEPEKENFQFSKNKLMRKKSSVPEWVSETKKIMLSSKKVVSFLSPNFLSNKSCIDNYNLAMCLSRKQNDNLLAPVYLETMPYVPTYLTLTQWIDCRRKDKDPPDLDKIFTGARILMDLLKSYSIIQDSTFSSTSGPNYDIFISYSHRDEERVKRFYEAFNREKPDLRIFFDRNELRAGISWQATLYAALNNSSVVICFLSNTYAESIICREEFSIALSQYLSDTFTCHTVSVLLDDWSNTKVDPMFSACPCLNGNIADDCVNKEKLLKYVCNILENPESGPLSLKRALKAKRELFIRDSWNVDPKFGYVTINLPEPIESTVDDEKMIVSCVIICHSQEQTSADVFSRLIKHLGKANVDGRTWNVSIISVDNAANMKRLEEADVVLPLLSSAFCVSVDTFNLLQVAIGCARNGICHLVPFIMNHLPTNPSFIHLLQTMFSFEDTIWKSLANNIERGISYPLEFVDNVTYRQWNSDIVVPLHVQLVMRVTAEWILYISKKSPEKGQPILSSIFTIRESGFLKQPDGVEFKPRFLSFKSDPLNHKVEENDNDQPSNQVSNPTTTRGDVEQVQPNDQTVRNKDEITKPGYANSAMIPIKVSQDSSKPTNQSNSSIRKDAQNANNIHSEFKSNSRVNQPKENKNSETRLCNIL